MNYYQKYLKYKDKYIKLKELRGGEQSEGEQSEIAIVCHCSPQSNTQHAQLYYIYNDKSIQMIDKNIRYVDTTCPEDSWDKIDDNSLMYIWGIGCPIYKSFDNNTIIINILSQAYSKLKVGGEVYFSIFYDEQFLFDDQKLEEFFKNMCKDKDFPYTYQTKQKNDFLYIIADDSPMRNSTIKEYHVFTKI